MNTDKIYIVVWFVDDHVDRQDVQGPFEDCIRNFAVELAGGKQAMISSVAPPQLTIDAPPALAAALCWLKTFKLPNGIRLADQYDREVEILAYGIDDWDPLKDYLSLESEGGLKGRPFWPHLVITDLFRGELKVVTELDGVKLLDGYKFAMQCSDKKIPCIVITSEPSAMVNFKPLWQGTRIHHFSRDEFRKGGDVFTTLKLLWPSLRQRWWIPEFTLAVEGRKNPNKSSFHVTFTKDGKIVSRVMNVSATMYAVLYLCAYGSILARLNGWEEELLGWEKSSCIAVSFPVTQKVAKIGECIPQVPRYLSYSFEPKYWASNKDEIFYGNNSQLRNANVLNTNIIHLDSPLPRTFPLFWDGKLAKENLLNSLREILPPEGMKWLEECCPIAKEITTSILTR